MAEAGILATSQSAEELFVTANEAKTLLPSERVASVSAVESIMNLTFQTGTQGPEKFRANK